MDKSILSPQQTREVDLYLRLGELFNRPSSSINQRHVNGCFIFVLFSFFAFEYQILPPSTLPLQGCIEYFMFSWIDSFFILYPEHGVLQDLTC